MGFNSCTSLIFSVLIFSASNGFLSGSGLVIVDGKDNQAITNLLNSFTFNFQKQISKVENGNIVFSPFSIYSGLAMLSMGSAGETRREITKVLGWDIGNIHLLLEALNNMSNKLSSDKSDDVILNSASNGWLSDDFNLLETFQAQMQIYFGVAFKVENFRQPESARININNWISHRTGYKINELFPAGAINSMTKIILANAVYFKGKWASPFDQARTSFQPFYLHGNNVGSNVPFMHQSGDFLCGTYRNMQLLELPYGSEGKFVMLLARPLHQSEIWNQQQSTDIMELSRQMNPLLLKQSMKSLRTRINVDIHVPRFTLNKKIDLKEQLGKMGIKDVFRRDVADLSPINGRKNLYVSSARHQAFLQVNEEGTEAGAATGFEIRPMSMPLQIRFNRPFLFYIINKATSCVVFAGRVMNPSIQF